MVHPLYQAGVSPQSMVRKNKFASPCCDDFKMLLPNQLLEFLEFRLEGHQIVALRVQPKPLESGIVNEDVRSSRCIRAVFEIEITPIQNQDVAVYIKRYGRQRPKIMVHDQFSFRRLQEYLGEWPRR